MIHAECPWCDGPAAIADALECAGCGITVELAEDEESLAQAA